MAPSSPVKRRMSSPGRAAKRTRPNLIPTVVNAICGAEAVPGDLRTLLKQALPIVLKANKEERHSYETLVVDQAQQALTIVQGEREKAHKDALGKQNEMISPAEDARRTSAKQQAENKVAAAKAQLENCKLALKAAETAEEEAADSLKKTTRDAAHNLTKTTHEGDLAIKAAQKEESAAEKELQKYTAKLTVASGALAHEFVMLQTGNSASAEGKKAVQKLLGLGKEYGLDHTLLGVLPIAAKKHADARTEFEAMSFTNLHSLMTTVINDLTQHVAAAEPAKAAKAQAVAEADAAKAQAVANAEAEKTAAVTSAKETLEAAKAAAKAAEEQLSAAQEGRSEASKELTKADAHLRHIWEDMRQACDAQDEAALDVRNLTEQVFTAFEQLKEKQPEPEPVEEPEPMDLAAPEAASEAAPEAAAPEAAAA